MTPPAPSEPGAPRLALVAAMHFPVPQGSQVYIAQQAGALVEAGARVTLLCYGGRPIRAGDWPFDVVRTPAWTAPRSHAAGPRASKSWADAALLAVLFAQHRARRFDAVLAHNAEAALLANLARRALGVPVVYVAHTLLGEELGLYGPDSLAGLSARFGGALDRQLARRADAVLALSEPTRAVLQAETAAPVVLIPPGLCPGAAPRRAEVARQCAAHDLEPDGFALYSGNLDAYQDVELLGAAARLAPEIPIVIATHDESGAAARDLEGVRILHVGDAEAMHALTCGAAVALCPRRVCPGFPIKLLNYMAAGRAILGREGIGGTLRHGHDAWLLSPEAGARQLADALRILMGDAPKRALLGARARATLDCRHAWPELAVHTLDLVRTLLAPRPASRGCDPC